MPTEVIRPKFDIVRGWPNGSAHDRTFNKVQDNSGDPLKIRQGTIVTVNANGAATPATVLLSPTEFALWMTIEGNDESDSYSGDYLDKAVCVKGSFEVVLSDTMFEAGAFAPGVAVSVLAGKVKVADGANVGVGHVVSYDDTSKILQISFTF